MSKAKRARPRRTPPKLKLSWYYFGAPGLPGALFHWRFAPVDRTFVTISNKTRHNDRRCCGTGEALEPEALAIRFVLDPDGVLTPDLAGKLPGRGAWVSASREALMTALKRGGFSRGFKGPATLPEGMDAEGFADRVAQLLEERALSTLGLARRGGGLICGFGAVKDSAPKMAAYLSAGDAAADGVQKIVRKVEATSKAPHIKVPASSERISHAIGTDGTIHMALLFGPSSDRALYELHRWCGFVAPLDQGNP